MEESSDGSMDRFWFHLFYPTSDTDLSEVLSAAPRCRAFVTAAPSPPSCVFYPGTGRLRDKQMYMTFFKDCSFKVTTRERSNIQPIQDIQNRTSLFQTPTIPSTPHTLHKVIHTLQANKKQLPTRPELLTAFRLRDKHNAKLMLFFHAPVQVKAPAVLSAESIALLKIVACFFSVLQQMELKAASVPRRVYLNTRHKMWHTC